MKSITFLIIFLLFSSQVSFSQEINDKNFYQGFIGGMFYHYGKVPIYTDNEQININHANTLGIGGKLAFNFTRFFRIGFEGYSSKAKYNIYDSYIEIGWGGILFETGFKISNFRPFAGITTGGGRLSHLSITSEPNISGTYDNVLYNSYSTFIYSPYAGIEYHFRKRLSFTLKSDFLRTINNNFEGTNGAGVRIYFGILFRKE